MRMIFPRLMALAVMLLIIGAAQELKLTGFEHPELDAVAAATLATILTLAAYRQRH